MFVVQGERMRRSRLWFVCELQSGDNASSQLLRQPSLYCTEHGGCTFHDRINNTPELDEGAPFDKRIRDKDSLRSFSFSLSRILAFFSSLSSLPYLFSFFFFLFPHPWMLISSIRILRLRAMRRHWRRNYRLDVIFLRFRFCLSFY